jgi:broad specificity phosphatase PhoE
VKRFCLVRHGQTDWNRKGRFQGQSDTPLNQTGRAEAQSLAGQLKGYSFAAIFTSDLIRARETAEIIATVLELPVTAEPRLREIKQGEWEGQFMEDIRARNAEGWDERKIDPANFHPPGGESVTEVAERTQAAMRNIVHLYPTGLVLIVSHGLALATIICKEGGIPMREAFQHIPENAIPTWVDWKDSPFPI